jgi:hypothetical protein
MLGAGDQRLPLAFRVGVSGRIDIEEGAVKRIREDVDRCLATVRAEISAYAKTPAAKMIYRGPEDGPTPYHLRVVSPLAEGSDRLVAEAARAMGAELFFPLPFPVDQYKLDFPNSAGTFVDLLGKGQAFEIDGLRDGKLRQEESYEAVGRFVVGSSDLLIAIWDGEPALGIGGTGHIVRFAVRMGQPVWWIDQSGKKPPRFLRKGLHFHAPERAPTGDAAYAELREWLRQSIEPPPLVDAEREGVFGWVAEFGLGFWGPDPHPLHDFLAEQPRAAWFFWLAFDGLRTFAGGSAAAPEVDEAPNEAQPPTEPQSAEAYWNGLLRRPDEAADSYSQRYRSSYVWIALLAVVALAAAAVVGDERAMAGSPQAQVVFGGLEFLAIGMIMALVIINHARRWQERWISYRLLAELCRKQSALCGIGWALPGADIVRLAAGVDEKDKTPRGVWVAWYFMAALRGAPPPEGGMVKAKTRAFVVGKALVAEQNRYHRDRGARSHFGGRRIRIWSDFLFILTVVF